MIRCCATSSSDVAHRDPPRLSLDAVSHALIHRVGQISGRCDKHELALGPDGECVLCRRKDPAHESRENGTHPPPESAKTDPLRTVALLGVLLSVIIGAAILWKRGERPSSPTAEPANATTPSPLTTSPSAEARSGTHAFLARHPLSSPVELERRGGPRVEKPYVVTQEQYELLVPPSYSEQAPHGLLVWIHAGPRGAIPKAAWPRVLEQQRLIWVGPNNVGNRREVTTRVALTLDAISAVGEDYVLDEQRIYVAGFSGGAKSAIRALLLYADVFRGGIFFAGADYFRAVPAPATGAGRTYTAGLDRPLYLSKAKDRPFAFVTGKKDFNYAHVSAIYAAMRADGFTRARLFVGPALGHELPEAAVFAQTIEWLDKAP